MFHSNAAICANAAYGRELHATRYLSTFSGIGGFELGMALAAAKYISSSTNLIAENDNEQAANDNTADHDDDNATKRCKPFVCVGYSEIDRYADRIYKRHFPNHTNFGDITTIDERALPDFDLLVGGFPCQAFSIAGKRKGFVDTRGTLFFDIVRIVREKQPRLLLLENVKGLLSHDQGRTFLTIITALDELGYDCQWQVLNSKNFGVPQNRERVYIVGHLGNTPRPEVFPLFGTAGKAIAQLNRPRHGNNRLYGIRGISPALNTMQGGGRQPYIRTKNATTGTVIRRLTPKECERLQGFPDGWTEGVSESQRYKALGNAVTVPVIKAIFERLLGTGEIS